VFGPAINGLIDDIVAGGDLPSDVPLGGQETKASRGAAGKGGKGAGGSDGETTVPPMWIQAPPPGGDGDAAPPSGPRSTTVKPKAPNGSEHRPGTFDRGPRSLLSRRTLAIPEAHGLAWNPEYIVYVREMYRVVAFKKTGKTLTQIRDESGVRPEWPSECAVHAFIRDLTVNEYNARRHEIHGPCAGYFIFVYKKSFNEIKESRRIGMHVPLRQFAVSVAGMTRRAYQATYKQLGSGYPHPNHCKNIYGETYGQISGTAQAAVSSTRVVELYKSGMSVIGIADALGSSKTAVAKQLKKAFALRSRKEAAVRRAPPPSRFDATMVLAIHERIRAGETQTSVAKSLGCSIALVNKIWNKGTARAQSKAA